MSEKLLTMGVLGSSKKKNERRAPLDPKHLPLIDEKLRQHIYMETGYGERFGVNDDTLASQVAGLMSREELFAHCDIILLPKPVEADFPYFREGQILWGWPHCVQGQTITQVGIDKKMTFIAWEAMNIWKDDKWQKHIFQKNNELAGYSSVLHALQLKGLTGSYGPSKRIAVISFGATARGAVGSLLGQGFQDITVFTRRPTNRLTNQIAGIEYQSFSKLADNPTTVFVETPAGDVPIAKVLAEFDIIVNCIFQDTERPLLYIEGDEIDLLKPDTLIIDVSCDTEMGFDFARPTSFTAPTFMVGKGITYYAVDHSPSYLWRAATYEISKALLPFIEPVMRGQANQETEQTLKRAIEIENGIIRNPEILRFQNRSETYPHLILE
ncbi:MAG: alanine dehydrogenase [Chloroflexi bacterium]|nr:alanine dehydrogenase [Chloroflexota bacterium]